MTSYNFITLKRSDFILALLMGAAFLAFVNADYYHGIEGVRLLNIFGNHATSSAIDCCRSCSKTDQCVLSNYNDVTQNCTFANDGQLSNITAVIDRDWMVYRKILNLTALSLFEDTPAISEPLPPTQNLAFLAVAGLGYSVYNAFTSGTNALSTPQCGPSNHGACTQHFRNSSLGSWGSLNLKTVRYSLFENGTEVAYVVFNGTSSTSTNWFSPTNVLESSWSSLLTTTFSSPPNNFAIQSWDTQLPFMMCTGYGGCSSDSFYSVIVDGSRMCAYGSQSSYPQILYSKVDGPMQPESRNNMGKADALAIFLEI